MQTITCSEILAKQSTGTPVICFDVRDEILQRHFSAGGSPLPYNKVEQHAARLAPHVNTLVVVCAMRPKGCQKTIEAAKRLRKLGFTDVRELEGGLMQGWIQKVGPKVKMPGFPQTQTA